MQLCQNSINCVNGKWVIRFRADHHGFMLETHILPFHKWGLTNNMRRLNEKMGNGNRTRYQFCRWGSPLMQILVHQACGFEMAKCQSCFTRQHSNMKAQVKHRLKHSRSFNFTPSRPFWCSFWSPSTPPMVDRPLSSRSWQLCRPCPRRLSFGSGSGRLEERALF